MPNSSRLHLHVAIYVIRIDASFFWIRILWIYVLWVGTSISAISSVPTITMLILLEYFRSFVQPIGESIIVSDHVSVASMRCGRVAARTFVGGTTRREESTGLHETLHVSTDSVSFLGEDVAIIG